MKTLVLIRHAKSSWAQHLQADFDRPLNDRGERDAPRMGKRLKKLGVVPDLVVASTARRAAQTAEHIAAGVGYDAKKIQWAASLYHASPSTLETFIQSLDNRAQTVFVVAHNNGLTEFANSLSPGFQTENMATCAAVGVRMDIDAWADFPAAEKPVFLYEYPKKSDD